MREDVREYSFYDFFSHITSRESKLRVDAPTSASLSELLDVTPDPRVAILSSTGEMQPGELPYDRIERAEIRTLCDGVAIGTLTVRDGTLHYSKLRH